MSKDVSHSEECNDMAMNHSETEKIEIKMVEQKEMTAKQKEMVAEQKEMSVEQTEETVLGNQLMNENKRSRKARNRLENELNIKREQTKANALKRELLKEEIRLRKERKEQQRLMKEEERLKKNETKQQMLENKKEQIRIREERKLKKLEKEQLKQELQQKKQQLQLSNNDQSHSKENTDKTMDNQKKETNEIKKEAKKKVEQKEMTAEEKEKRALERLLMKEEKLLRMEKRRQQRLIKEEEKLNRQRIKQQKIDEENERIRVREERKLNKVEKEKLKQELKQKKLEERENRQKYEEEKKQKKLEEKRIAEEEALQKRRETALKGMTYLLNISEKYSSFFREKLLKTNFKGSSKPLLERNRLKPSISDMKEAAADTNTKLSKENDAVNIRKQLKYFEGGQLRQYQIEGVQWLNTLFENGINGILADEMGLGKTVQIIALICNLLERKISGPFLIVAPLSTIPNWDMEFKRFAPEVPLVVFHGNEGERQSQCRLIRKKYTLGGFRTYPVILTTYQVPLTEFKFLSGFEWQYIIIDEGHYIKNHQTKLAVNLRKLNSSNRLLLTGTPIHNSITELWALLNFLLPDIFNNVDTFATLLAIEDVQDGDKLIEQEEKNKLLSTIHNVLEPFLLRRLKKDVLGELVPKKEMNIFCPLSKLQRELYSYVLNKNISLLLKHKEEDEDVPLGPRKKRPRIDYCIDESGDDSFNSEPEIEDKSEDEWFGSEPEIEDEELLTGQKMEEEPITDQKMEVEPKFIVNITMQSPVIMFKKIVDHPYLVHFPLDPNSATKKLLINEDLVSSSGKMIVLDQMLKRLKENGHKVLIFSTMVICLDFIEEMFIMRGYTYCRLDGSNDLEQRKESIESFNKDPNILAFLLSTRAGGLGINLTGADTVIFYDRDWNPQADIQAQDRCHRIGQTKPVMIYSLVTKNTIDEDIIETGYKKRMLEKVVIKDGKFQKKSSEKPDVTKLAKELRELQELLQTESNYFQDPAAAIEEMDKLMNRSELYAQMNMEYTYKPIKNEKEDTSFKNMNTNKINTTTTKLKVSLLKCDLINESHN